MAANRMRTSGRRGGLRAFQEALSRRIAAAETVVREDVRLGVKAGSGNWLLKLADAGELLPIPDLTPVPLTHAWFRGMANVRGVLYAVADLAAFLGEPLIARQPQARLMLVGRRYGMNAALLVEQVFGLRNLRDFSAVEQARGAPWAGAQYRDAEGRHWCELEVVALLQSPEFTQVGS